MDFHAVRSSNEAAPHVRNKFFCWCGEAKAQAAARITKNRLGLGIYPPETHIEKGWLGDGDFFVDAEDVAKRVADFAESGIGFDGFVDVRHQIFVALGGFAQRFQAALNFSARAIRAEFVQALGLAMRDGFVDEQRIDGFFLGDEIVHADNDFFLAVHFHLIAVRRFRDFALRIRAFDGIDHAA